MVVAFTGVLLKRWMTLSRILRFFVDRMCPLTARTYLDEYSRQTTANPRIVLYIGYGNPPYDIGK